MSERSGVLAFLLAVFLGGAMKSAPGPSPQAGVEMLHLKPAVKLEAPVEGFLTPLNGHLKLRATEIEFEPGGSMGDHLHAGPGIRTVLSGELVITDSETGKEQRVPVGGYFYEGGDKSLRVQNRGTRPARMLVVELLPVAWQGPSAVVISRAPELKQEGQRLAGILRARQ